MGRNKKPNLELGLPPFIEDEAYASQFNQNLSTHVDAYGG